MKKILILSLCTLFMLGSMCVYASEINENADPTIIIVKGEKNIEAYEKAGLIKKCKKVESISSELEGYKDVYGDFSTRGTSVPTSTWDLKNESRNFTYSFSSYIYSNYKYLPERDSLSSTGYGIYHKFYPDANQEMKIYCYDSSGDNFFTKTLQLDDTTAWGLAVKNEANYFKYKSTEGTKIKGSGKVY